jgi:hypothetical protein
MSSFEQTIWSINQIVKIANLPIVTAEHLKKTMLIDIEIFL